MPSYQMFDSAYGACYSSTTCAVPAARHHPIAVSGGLCLRTPGYYALALTRRAARRQLGPAESTPTSSSLVPHASLVAEDRAADPAALLGDLLGHHPLQVLAVPPRRARQSSTFLDVFRKSSKFSEVQAVCRDVGGEPARRPVSGRLRGAELAAAHRRGSRRRPSQPAAAGRPTLKSLDAVDRALLRATTVEMTKLERRVPFLATTASITPFIGLFGTVWGIMSCVPAGSARRARRVSASSRRGIAEALIATAAGLFAAIPAVYFYNHFTNRVKQFAAEMDDFSLEFLNISERNFT